MEPGIGEPIQLMLISPVDAAGTFGKCKQATSIRLSSAGHASQCCSNLNHLPLQCKQTRLQPNCWGGKKWWFYFKKEAEDETLMLKKKLLETSRPCSEDFIAKIRALILKRDTGSTVGMFLPFILKFQWANRGETLHWIMQCKGNINLYEGITRYSEYPSKK